MDPILERLTWATIDGANTDFQTSVAYWPGTLRVYLNGQLIGEADDDGPVELGGLDFRLGIAPRVGDYLDAWFRTEAPTPGAYVRPPRPAKAVHLTPDPQAAVDLRPVPQATEVPDDVDLTPRPSKAVELTPEGLAAVDLRPKPVRAEEV